MSTLKISKISGKILVIGSIYDRIEKISNKKEIFDKYELIIINGNLCYPFDDLVNVNNRIHIMNDLLLSKKCLYNTGAYDLKLLQILSENYEHKDIQNWIKSKPNVIDIKFENQSSILIVNGGIPIKITTNSQLDNDIEVSFISNIDGKPWQNYYGGQLGYVISNHPLTSDSPHFYPYAMQMGIKYSKDVNIYAQEIDQFGLKETILL